MFPDVAVSEDKIVTIVWREWVDDYQGGKNGYFSVYYCQYFVDDEGFYDVVPPDPAVSISRLSPFEEQILVNEINTIHKESPEPVIVAATDVRVTWEDYDLDSHIRVLFQEDIGAWSFKLNMITTREYWVPEQTIGGWDGVMKQPDIDIDGKDKWHLVYAATRPPFHNSWEVYYRNAYQPNELLISGPNSDGKNSYCPRIVTHTYDGGNCIDAYIVWIDEAIQPAKELYYSKVDAFNFLVPSVGQRVPWVPPGPPREEGQHEIALDEQMGIIHAVYQVCQQLIHHGSMDLACNPAHIDNRVDREAVGWEYKNPAIDIGFDSRPYIVYVEAHPEQTSPANIYYDVLQSTQINGNDVFDNFNPKKVDDQNGGDDDVDNPDIMIDRSEIRRGIDYIGNPNPFVHITWIEFKQLRWSIFYSKLHPLTVARNSEIFDRELHPGLYSVPNKKPDPELAMTSEDYVALIYSARTMGYKANPGNNDYNRMFYTLLDNNGQIRTTNTIISENDDMHVINSASDIDSSDQLYCAWDLYDPTTAQWDHTITWRYHNWQSD